MIRHLFFCTLCVFFFLGCSSDQEKIENFIKEGQTYLGQKEYGKANIQLQNALELNPKSVAAYKVFVKLHMAQKDIQKTFQTLLTKARTRIDQVLKKEPDNIKALSLQASMLILEEQPMETIANVYERILTLDPSNANAMVMLAKISHKKGESAQARILLEKAVTTSPDNFKIYTELYAYYLTNKDMESAKDVLKRLAHQKPSDPNPQILLGNFYAIQNEPEMAEAAYEKAIEVAPEDADGYMAIAQFYDRKGEPHKAEASLADAIKKNPDDMALQLVYARFMYDHKKMNQAFTIVDKILEKKGNYQPAMELKGRILLAQNKPEPASILFSSLLKEDSESPVYNYLMASALMDMNKPDLAMTHASKAMEKAPEYFEPRFLMADLYYKRKDFSLADAEIKKALKIRPEHYLGLLLQAKIYNALGQKETAEAMYKDLIQKDPSRPAPYFNLGNLYLGKKDLVSARENYSKAMEKEPYLMDVFTRLIQTYALEKKFQEGIRRCDDQLQKIQNHPIVASIIFNQKGNLFMGMKDLEQAKAAYELSLKENPRPDQAGTFSTIGSLYETQGKMDKAEESYVKALEINPSHVQALNNLAFLYADQNREMNRALEYARKAREVAGEVPAVMDTLGWVYYRKQLHDAAIQEFASCIKKQPENPMFHYHMGLALQAKGDTQAARVSLQKALDIGREFPGKKDAQDKLKQMQ